MKTSYVKDMTTGKPTGLILMFMLPMVIGNVFQQLYNMVDSMIVGQVVGADALAAVGATGSLNFLFFSLCGGMANGIGVVLSQYFGAGNKDKVKQTIANAVYIMAVVGVFMGVLGALLSRPVLTFLKTPDNILDDAVLYMRIMCLGVLAVAFYNCISAILRAVGDSKTPLYFLIGSSVGNILLDMLFVAVFQWGVAGVAWATFIAQGAACILALISFGRRMREIKTEGRAALFSFSLLKKISMIAVPSILQQSFVSVGNIFIQSLVNSYGSGVIAGYSAAIKLNTFVITGFTTLGNGVSGFTAQNRGAGKQERIKDGFMAGLKMAVCVAVPFFVAYFFFGRAMVLLFMDDTGSDALRTGIQFLKIVSPFYFVIAVKLVADGMLRGAERMKEFMASTFTDLILRVILAFIFSANMGSVGIWLAWPVGWGIATVMSWMFCRRDLGTKRTITEDKA